MKTLKRNCRQFYYAQYVSKENIFDSNGHRTGEHGKNYGTPVAMVANISPARGTTDLEIFGEDLNYTRTICTDDVNCPITEESILWIDTEPCDHLGNPYPHNYVVTQIAKSLNNIMYAIRKVDVS